MSKLHVGIFGPGLSGKTTLAKFTSKRTFERRGVRSIVLDPIGSNWGQHADVYSMVDEEAFWKKVWETRNALVFLDEGAETVGRKKEMIPAFTRIRHNEHKMVVIGHRVSATLLPVMRDQISTLYLARQTKKSCEIWAEQFVDDRIYHAMKLREYQFLWVEMFGNAVVMNPEDYFVPNPAKALPSIK